MFKCSQKSGCGCGSGRIACEIETVVLAIEVVCQTGNERANECIKVDIRVFTRVIDYVVLLQSDLD